MGKQLIIAAERCTGCNSCMLTCSFAHDDYFSLVRSRIQVKKNTERAISTPKVCIQCDEAPCIASCSEGALSRDEILGTIRIDGEKCTGCKKCISACPYGGIFFDEENLVPLICDLCGGNPACIDFCKFPQALRYE